MTEHREKDIARVRREEMARGRSRPHPVEAERRTRRVKQLIEEGTEEEFAQALIARGWQRASPKFVEALSAFRAAQQQHRSRP